MSRPEVNAKKAGAGSRFRTRATRCLLLVCLFGSGLVELRAGDDSAGDDAAIPKGLRSTWEELSEEDRARLLENLRRWREMAPEERQLMRERHQRWKALQRSLTESLPQDERQRIERLGDRDRRRELQSRAQDLLRERLRQLPPNLRELIQERLKSLPAAERKMRVEEIIQNEISVRIDRHLNLLGQRGLLTKPQIENMKDSLRGKPAEERFRTLKDWMIDYPDRFDISRQVRDRLMNTNDPFAAVRVMEKFNREELRPLRARLAAFLREQDVPEEELRAIFQSPLSEFSRYLDRSLRKHELRLPEALEKAIKERGARGGTDER